MNTPYIIFDFETTGLSPALGDRTIEVGAVLVENDRITEKFQTLMNPGRKIPAFIESYTGITNKMLVNAPSNSESMTKFLQFIGNTPLIAHNASFDKRFLESEFNLIGKTVTQPIACSLLVARRLYPEAPNHKLMTLIKMNNIKISGDFHRALADAEMTAYLWIKMCEDISKKYQREHVDFNLMKQLSQVSKKDFFKFMMKKSG